MIRTKFNDMYFIVYKTTNAVNGKIYIGQRLTKNLNDGYVGSGTYFRRALKKIWYSELLS